MTLTLEQRRVLLHTLGLSDRQREPYRNYFVACPGHYELPVLEALVSAGIMEQLHRPGFLPEDDMVFAATIRGQNLAMSMLPKISRGRTRYQRWIDINDVDPDLTFGEFLRRRLYNQYSPDDNAAMETK